ncbi:MAG: hypothetical protein ABW021_01830 [Acidimicrobiia bacterium]
MKQFLVCATLEPTTTEATTTTEAATTTTIATTTTVDPVVAAGTYYIESVTPLNCAGQATDPIWDEIEDEEGYISDTDWEQIQSDLQPAYAVYAQAAVAFLEALSSYHWPENVQADIEALMAEVSAEAAWAQAMSEAGTYADFTTVNEETLDNRAAAIVRAKLNLPTNIGATTDC